MYNNILKFKLELYPHQINMISSMMDRESSKSFKFNISNNYVDVETYDYYSLSNTRKEHVGDIITIYTNMMVLNSPPGSGKTLAVYGLISMTKSNKLIPTKEYMYASFNNFSYVHIKSKELEYSKKMPTLIIANHNLISSVWESEIKHTDLSYINYMIPKMFKTPIDISTLEKYDVVLLSSKYLKNIFFTIPNIDKIYTYTEIPWNRVVVDEFDTEKKIHINISNVGFIWLISGTWPFGDLQESDPVIDLSQQYRNLNLKNEYHPSENNVLSNFLGLEHWCRYLTIFSKPSSDFYKGCEKIFKNWKCKKTIKHIFSDILPENIQELIEKSEYSNAMVLLGSNHSTNLVESVNLYFDNKITNLQHQITDHTTSYAISQLETLIKNKATFIERVSNQMDDSNCNICCLEDILEYTLLSCCGNIICSKCAYTYINQSNVCIYCRSITNLKSLYVYTKSSLTIEKEKNILKTKQEIIREICLKPNTQILVIGPKTYNSKNSYNNILINEQIIYKELTGTQKNRVNIVNDYNNKKIKVLYINDCSDIVGLNLTITDDLIFCENVQSHQQEQSISRADRLGRNILHPLTIHKFTE